MVFKTAILLQNVSKTYCQGDSIVGTLEVDTDNQEVAHEGINIHLSGNIAILRSKMRFVYFFIILGSFEILKCVMNHQLDVYIIRGSILKIVKAS